MVDLIGAFTVEMFGEYLPLFYSVLYSIVIIVVAYFVKKVVTDRIIGSFAKRVKIEESLTKPMKTVIGVVIYIVAAFAILGAWGLEAPLYGLLTGAGIMGIVIGFAVKDVLSNLLAGIILFFDRPFKIGDAIKIGDISGQVRDIGLRTVKVKSWDGQRVTIPNSKVESGIIYNYHYYPSRRLEVKVGVDYKTDLKKAAKLIEKALKNKEFGILEDPAPNIMVSDFNDSSIDFTIRFWIKSKGAPMGILDVYSSVREEINKEFKKARITIPFPQVTISKRRK